MRMIDKIFTAKGKEFSELERELEEKMRKAGFSSATQVRFQWLGGVAMAIYDAYGVWAILDANSGETALPIRGEWQDELLDILEAEE